MSDPWASDGNPADAEDPFAATAPTTDLAAALDTARPLPNHRDDADPFADPTFSTDISGVADQASLEGRWLP